MFAHYSSLLVVLALVLGPSCASEAPAAPAASAAPAAAAADVSGFLAAKPRVFAVNPAADSAGALTGARAESFGLGGAGGQADVAPPPELLPAKVTEPVRMSDGNGEAFPASLPQQAGAMTGAGAMPAAPGEGGSSGTSTVMNAVGITVLVMSLCFCAVAYCCCKELCGCIFGGGGDGAGAGADAGDYDMGNMAEAGPLVAAPLY